MKRKALLIITVLVLSFSFNLNNTLNTSSFIDNNNTSTPIISKLDDSLPIIITKDSEFESHAKTGDGSESNPYIIENLNITTLDLYGINISHTTANFWIRNCHIDSQNGIAIYDAIGTNLSINGNNITSYSVANTYGIQVY